MSNLKPIPRVVVEEAFYEQKRVVEQAWFHDLHIADEVALERLAAWRSHLHDVADREMQQLAWQRMRDELNDKELQLIFAHYATVGVTTNGFYVEGKPPYDQAILELRALDVEIARLNRQIDGLANKISEAKEQFWQEATETIRNETAVSADDIFAKYVEESDMLLEEKEYLQGKQSDILNKIKNIDNQFESNLSMIKQNKIELEKVLNDLHVVEEDRDLVNKKLTKLDKKIANADTYEELRKLYMERSKWKNVLSEMDKKFFVLDNQRSLLLEAIDSFQAVIDDLKKDRHSCLDEYSTNKRTLSEYDTMLTDVETKAVDGIKNRVNSLYAENRENAAVRTADLTKQLHDLIAARDEKVAARKELSQRIPLSANRKPSAPSAG